MSKAKIWQFPEFLQSRKEKLINMLISEIIFLKTRFNKANNYDKMNHLEKALDKLDYLLNKLKNYSSDIPEEDFDKMIMIIYKIFKDIVDNLEGEVRV